MARPLCPPAAEIAGLRYTPAMESQPGHELPSLEAFCEEEESRIRDLLERIVLLSRRHRKDLEKEMGLGSTGLSKILRGTVRLQFRHIVLILKTLDFDLLDFFELAYAGEPRRGRAEAARPESPATSTQSALLQWARERPRNS
jgi:transcriptional regulator with XRE-family HTH domain